MTLDKEINNSKMKTYFEMKSNFGYKLEKYIMIYCQKKIEDKTIIDGSKKDERTGYKIGKTNFCGKILTKLTHYKNITESPQSGRHK